MSEENKDGAISEGNDFSFSIGLATSDSVVSVTGVTGETPNGGYEVGQSTKEYLSYVNGALATTILYNSGGDQDYATVTYHGGESYGNLVIAESDSKFTSSGSLGNVLATDAEIANVKGKNLIIVGGSCINSAAATVLGVSGHTCGAAFTAATGVQAGEFLIKSVGDAYTTGKVALVVAGYEVADTNNAATYLTKKMPDVSAGNTYIGKTATEATLQVSN